MRTNIIFAFVALIIVLGGYMVLRKNSSAQLAASDVPQDAQIVSEGDYTIILDESVVNWVGRRPLLEGYMDRGTLGLKEGTLTASNGVGTGTIVFDMNTISVGETGRGAGNSGLERHLKSDDFFSVETFPIATLQITSVSPLDSNSFRYQVRGDLTIKGVTNTIEFPATIYQLHGDVYASASLSLDRTLWNIRYGSGKFFDNLANNVIDDMFDVSFTIIAR